MRYIVTAYFEIQDRYTVEADSEEEAIDKAQGQLYCYSSEGERIIGSAGAGPMGNVTYERDAEIECVDWDAMTEEGA